MIDYVPADLVLARQLFQREGEATHALVGLQAPRLVVPRSDLKQR